MYLHDNKRASTSGSSHGRRVRRHTYNSTQLRPKAKKSPMPFAFWNNNVIWESIFKQALLFPENIAIIQHSSRGVPKDLLSLRLVCRAAEYGSRGAFAKCGIFETRSLTIVPKGVESLKRVANQYIFAKEVVKLIIYVAPETIYLGIPPQDRDYHRCSMMQFQNMKSTKKKIIEALQKLQSLRHCEVWVSHEQREQPRMTPADPMSSLWKDVAVESSMNFIAGLPWKELQVDQLSLHLTRRLYDMPAFRVNVSTWFSSIQVLEIHHPNSSIGSTYLDESILRWAKSLRHLVITANHWHFFGNPGDVLEWRRRLKASGKFNLNLQCLSLKRCICIRPRILIKLISLFGGESLPKLILANIKLSLDGQGLEQAMTSIAHHCRSCVLDVELVGIFEAWSGHGQAYVPIHRDQVLSAFHGRVRGQLITDRLL
jgi:hypothetical protein